MELYLIRHAHAVPAAADPERPLSKKGREQIRRLAALLGSGGAFAPSEIWHSPLSRSRQTARLLVKLLALGGPVSEVPGLEPEGNPRTTATRVRATRRSLAVVGHEPQLSALASLLVTGAATPAIFKFRKSAVLALRREAPDRWVVLWQLAPELLIK